MSDRNSSSTESENPAQENNLRKANPMQLQEGDYYFNEAGFMVFTEQYLLRRGFCCGSGCRHCPYDWENVVKRK